MKFGDFFKSAPTAQPVNPEPVKFFAHCNDPVLPDGSPNPSERLIKAEITAAFAFLNPDGAARARMDARASLEKRCKDNKDKGWSFDEADLTYETKLQELWRILREWDETARKTGGLLFSEIETMRRSVESGELMRVYGLYIKYASKEHPEGLGPDKEAFRSA